jgi:DNA-directed RNA polymerase subunit RPC12/RpoP
LWHIKNRLKRNKNYLGVICGETGSGKSFTALCHGELLDPDFSIDKVCLNAKKFMWAIQKFKAGSVIIFDEAGVGMPSREWMALSNRLLNYVLQTFRHKNLIVLFTVPDFSMIDSQARKLFHCYMQTTGIDKANKICYVKPLLIQNNPQMSKIYYKYLRVKTNGEKTSVKRVGFGMPSKELIEKYERKKGEFTDWLNRGVSETIKRDRFQPHRIPYICIKCGKEWRSIGSSTRHRVCPSCFSKHTSIKKDLPRGLLKKIQAKAL